MRALQLLLLAVALELVAPDSAHAYVDPSAGSLVLQVAAGVILGGLLTIRSWWTSVGDRMRLVWHRMRRK
jgi:hypothetical protein